MSRFTLRGNAKLYFHDVASLPADPTAITAAEIAAADDITGTDGGEAIESLNGWEESPSVIQTPDILSRQTGNIPGEVTTGEASIRYYLDDTTNPIWTLLPKGTIGAVSIHSVGIGTGKDYQYWPVQVINRTRMNATGNEGEKWVASFALGIPKDGVEAA